MDIDVTVIRLVWPAKRCRVEEPFRRSRCVDKSMHCIVVRAILSNSCGSGKIAMIESFGCYGNDPLSVAAGDYHALNAAPSVAPANGRVRSRDAPRCWQCYAWGPLCV